MLLELTMAEQRFNAVMEILRDGLMVIEVAKRYGVSRQTVHGWLRRYRTGGLDALADRSHRPRRCPHQMPAAVEARLCELRRRHPHWGQRRLAHELTRIGMDPPPGLTSIYRGSLGWASPMIRVLRIIRTVILVIIALVVLAAVGLFGWWTAIAPDRRSIWGNPYARCIAAHCRDLTAVLDARCTVGGL